MKICWFKSTLCGLTDRIEVKDAMRLLILGFTPRSNAKHVADDRKPASYIKLPTAETQSFPIMSQSALWGWVMRLVVYQMIQVHHASFVLHFEKLWNCQVQDVGRSCGFAPQTQTTPGWVRVSRLESNSTFLVLILNGWAELEPLRHIVTIVTEVRAQPDLSLNKAEIVIFVVGCFFAVLFFQVPGLSEELLQKAGSLGVQRFCFDVRSMEWGMLEWGIMGVHWNLWSEKY